MSAGNPCIEIVGRFKKDFGRAHPDGSGACGEHLKAGDSLGFHKSSIIVRGSECYVCPDCGLGRPIFVKFVQSQWPSRRHFSLILAL